VVGEKNIEGASNNVYNWYKGVARIGRNVDMRVCTRCREIKEIRITNDSIMRRPIKESSK